MKHPRGKQGRAPAAASEKFTSVESGCGANLNLWRSWYCTTRAQQRPVSPFEVRHADTAVVRVGYFDVHSGIVSALHALCIGAVLLVKAIVDATVQFLFKSVQVGITSSFSRPRNNYIGEAATQNHLAHPRTDRSRLNSIAPETHLCALFSRP